jgi:hypothetical protein
MDLTASLARESPHSYSLPVYGAVAPNAFLVLCSSP